MSWDVRRHLSMKRCSYCGAEYSDDITECPLDHQPLIKQHVAPPSGKPRHVTGTFTTTGGARLGWTNATWPLAQLSATPDRLTISIRLLDTYSFAPDQVSAVERYVMIPVLGWGVRIRHCNANCPQRVIFWCLGSPDRVLQGIRDSGFFPTAPRSALPQPRGIAMRWSAIIIAVAVWNALFFLDSGRSSRVPSHPGPLILAPLLFALALSVGTLTSPRLQRIILKPGRSVGEIKPFLRLLAFFSGFLLVVFSILLASGAFTNTSNKAAAGNARIASWLTIQHRRPSVPEPERSSRCN